MLALAALVVAVRYAEPSQDNDIFWHMAYARQMLGRGTLAPDATIYSWTPAQNTSIYCAWLGELLLYGLWSVAGLGGLFAARYAVIVAVAALLWLHAKRRGAENLPFAAMVILFVTLASSAGTVIKPELWSLLLFNLLLFVFFRARADARLGRDARKWFAAGRS
jgi:hypothetical protein